MSDAAAVAAVDQAAGILHAPHVPALVVELLGLGMSWLAEAADGRPAGYAIVSRRFYSRPFLELLAVHPEFRRAGVGSALVETFTSSFEDATVFTSTNQSNAPMQALLPKVGFEPSGIVHNLDPGDPELIYVRFR
jgi:ribosomal protein S18 acetylase RimI-like enzyme